jgi:AcrR family transcriptional regulator
MKSRPKRAPRRSPEETKERLVRALLKLLEKKSVGAVSVREVARVARVNHGLVHRHFGSKEDLVRAAVTWVSQRVHAEADEGLGARTFATLRGDPGLPIVIARACLDGPRDLLALAAPPPERLEEFVAPLRRMLERLGLPFDANVVNAFGTSALLGWFVFRPLLAHGYGLGEDADDRLEAVLRALDGFTAMAR